MSYLKQFIGNMSKNMLRRFLRFTTGSSVLVAQCSKITVAFNNLSGFACRPVRHTCDCLLELSWSYPTYLEVVSKFESSNKETKNHKVKIVMLLSIVKWSNAQKLNLSESKKSPY